MALSDEYLKHAESLSDSELAKHLALSDMRSVREINRDDFQNAGYILFRTDPSVIYKNKVFDARQSKSKNSKTSPLRTKYYKELNKLFKELKATRPEVSSAPFAPYHPDVEKMIKKGLTETKNKKLNKGGLPKKPKMTGTGSYKGKKHSYAAGGMVKELKI